MSVLIKRMRMPRDCDHCKFMYREYDFGVKMCYLGVGGGIDIDEIIKQRQQNCPLVEVPTPHGRLIDKDELEVDTEWSDYYDGYQSYSAMQIKYAPTVIESEE